MADTRRLSVAPSARPDGAAPGLRRGASSDARARASHHRAPSPASASPHTRPLRRAVSSRKSFGTALGSGQAAAAGLGALHVANMYSAVLKLSSENRITQKNSWQLPLIDHMQALIRPPRRSNRR